MWIKEAGFRPKLLQQPLRLQRQLAAERLRPQRPIQDQDAWPVWLGDRIVELGGRGDVQGTRDHVRDLLHGGCPVILIRLF